MDPNNEIYPNCILPRNAGLGNPQGAEQMVGEGNVCLYCTYWVEGSY